MDRVFTSGAAASPPSAPTSPSAGYPTAGNPVGGIPATTPGPWWYHMVTEELRAVVLASGGTPDHLALNQVATAIQALAGGASVSVQGLFKNLAASANGSSAAVSISADELSVGNGTGSYRTLRSIGLSIAGSTSGPNGLDTGSLSGATWYSVWVIFNGTTVAGLMSLSATAPTLPAGYTHKARVGWVRTDATVNKYPLAFTQFGRRVQYKVAAGSNVASLPQMASGVAGSISTPTWVAVATGNFVPSTASRIAGQTSVAGGVQIVMVAPNNVYGPNTSQTNQPPCVSNGASGEYGRAFEFNLESSNIYWASSLSLNAIFCFGWEDNL